MMMTAKTSASDMSAANSERKPILFLTTETSQAGNENLLKDPLVMALRQKGVKVSARSVLEWDRPLELAEHSYILFLCIWGYHLKVGHVRAFISQAIEQELLGRNVSNPARVVLWNIDKSVYLPELETAGFPVINTTYVPLPASKAIVVGSLQVRSSPDPVLLKPSISAASFSTYLIENSKQLSSIDESASTSFANIQDFGGSAKLMIQDFVPEIQIVGELSLMIVGGEITHAVRKTPREGDFRSQPKFGGQQAVPRRRRDTC
jgi:hypothetical protein